MTRDSPAVDPAEPGRPLGAYLLRLVTRIKQALREHLPSWETLPFDPPLDPFSQLGNDLGRLWQLLPDRFSPPVEAPPEAVADLLGEGELREVVHDAFLAVTSYVHFRWSLAREAPEAPSPRWLREEREELVGSLSRLSERLRPLRHLLETLTPMID